MRSFIAIYQRIGLIPLIIIGLILGTLIGWLAPNIGIALGILGTLFVGALKAVAPILVFILVMAAICQHRSGNKVYVKPVLFLYLLGTFVAALVAVGASFLFPTELTLVNATIEQVPPADLKEVLGNLLFSLVANPIDALANAN